MVRRPNKNNKKNHPTTEGEGSLEHLVQDEHRFPHFWDSSSNTWTVRNDVRNLGIMGGDGKITYNEWLQVPYSKRKHFGPDLQFGYIMAELTDAPVLLLKSCIGNRAIGWDLLPPGSKSFTYEGDGYTYAGYGDTPSRWKVGEPIKKVNWYGGKEYDIDVANAKKILQNLPDYYPEATPGNYRIEGFLWWQGDRDRRSAALASRYELNLVNLIKQLRIDFDAPDAKFVLATIGMMKYKMKGPTKQVWEAQMAMNDHEKYPEFQGNVKAVDIRSSVGKDAGYHYGGDAKTYMEVANAMGLAMAQLLYP